MQASKLVVLFFVILFILPSCSTTRRIGIYARKDNYERLLNYSKHRDSRLRRAVVHELKEKNDPNLIPILISVSKHSNDVILDFALEVLDNYQHEMIKEYYIGALQNKNSNARDILIKLKYVNKYIDSDFNEIMGNLLTHRNDEIKIATATAMAKSGDMSGESVVSGLLYSDFIGTRRLAVLSLGAFKNERHLPILETLLNDNDPVIRRNAGQALQLILGENFSERLAELRFSYNAAQQQDIKHEPSPVSLTIPKTNIINEYVYAVVIGNEDYKTYQSGLDYESNVKYAANDAKVFKQYLLDVVGVPERNIMFLINAGTVDMHQAIEKVKLINKNEPYASFIIYYAGHGLADQLTQEPFLMPVDVSASNLRFAINTQILLQELSEMKAPRITVILDACFSGGGRDAGLLSARAVRVRPKEGVIKGNLVVFAAASGIQTAHHYEEMRHGIFTYYFLKKIQETKGDLTYKELFDYVQSNVARNSILINSREQTPQLRYSIDIGDNWENWRFNKY